LFVLSIGTLVTLVGKLSTGTLKDNVAVVTKVTLTDISKLFNFVMMVTLVTGGQT
jgi:hypothetical protein